MRQEQFNQLIEKFETDPYFGIKVINLSTGLAITSDKDKQALVNEYGSVANFFNQIFSTGITQIAIQTRRKNGTGKGNYQNWKNGREPLLTFNLEPNNDIKEFVQPVVSIQPEFKPSAPVQYSQPSLAGPSGLSLPEMISLHVDRNDKTRLETENRFLKEKCDRLEKDNYDYKDRELASKYSSDKSDKNTELILGLVQHADKLKGIFTPAQALAPVAETMLGNPNISKLKQNIISEIQHTDDITADVLTRVFNALCDKEEFANKLNVLLQE